METKSIRSFTDLDVWRLGHEVVLEIYRLCKGFPRDELFGLTSQMKRCVISITSNIAEGFSRQSYKEKAQFYSIALGSTTELQNQIIVCRDVGFITNENFDAITTKLIRINKMLNSLIKGSKSRFESRNS